MAPRPKRPAKTAEQEALEVRQQKALDKEIEEEEQRLSLFRRGQLGRSSLLSGAVRTTAQAAGAARAAGGSTKASLLGGTGVRAGATTARGTTRTSAGIS